MRFEPKTEEELQSMNLLEGGEYDFEVLDAKDDTSKNGNDMVKLKLGVYGDGERQHWVYDYLVATEASAYKIRGFAESAGLLNEYLLGEINAEQMVGKTGRCQIGIQKDKSGQYPDKNIVRNYIKAESSGGAKKESKPANGGAVVMDDDIPFAPEWR